MAQSKQSIINDIREHIEKGGGGYNAWYVGISRNARDRLFSGHKVKEKDDWWIYRQANSWNVAKEIKRHFVNNLGADGTASGGGEASDKVYAYRKAPHTAP